MKTPTSTVTVVVVSVTRIDLGEGGETLSFIIVTILL